MLDSLKNARTEFPLWLESLPDSRREKFISLVQGMAAYIEQGEIPNARFGEVKTSLGALLGKAWQTAIGNTFFFGGRFQEQSALANTLWSAVGTPDSVQGFKSAHNKFTKHFKGNPVPADDAPVKAMHAFLEQAVPLYDAYDTLKGMVVKREVKSAEQREVEARYIPPMANVESEQRLKRALEQVVAQHYERLVTSLSTYYLDVLNYSLQEALTKSRLAARPSPLATELQRICLERQGSRLDSPVMVKLDAKALIGQEARKTADEMRDIFLRKNLRKLASIIDQKGNLETIEVTASSVSLTNLTGTLQFCFADQSSFVAKNSVVLSQSSTGKLFYRFPLTFHKALLPDGTLVRKLSEEWMNTVFAGAGQENPAPLNGLDGDESPGFR